MNVRREEEHIHRLFGGDSEKDPPVSMPNTEVKLLSAESTCLDTDRKDRTPPNFYSSLAQSVEPAAVNRVVVGSSPTGGAISVVRKGYRQSKPQDTESFLWFFAIYCVFRIICPFSIFFDFNGCFFADFHKNRSRTYDYGLRASI